MIKWYFCPSCRYKLLMIDDSKDIEGVFYKCNKCGKVNEILNKPNNSESQSQSRHIDDYRIKNYSI